MASAGQTPARGDDGPGDDVESRIVCPRAGDDTIPRDGPDGEGWRAGMTAEELAELAELAAAAKLDCGPPPNMGDVPSPEEEVAPEIGPRPNLFDHRPTEIDRSNVVVTMPAIGRNASRTAWKLGHVSRP